MLGYDDTDAKVYNGSRDYRGSGLIFINHYSKKLIRFINVNCYYGVLNVLAFWYNCITIWLVILTAGPVWIRLTQDEVCSGFEASIEDCKVSLKHFKSLNQRNCWACWLTCVCILISPRFWHALFQLRLLVWITTLLNDLSEIYHWR